MDTGEDVLNLRATGSLILVKDWNVGKTGDTDLRFGLGDLGVALYIEG